MFAAPDESPAMRRLALALAITFASALPLQARCMGTDLIAALPAPDRAALEQAADSVPFAQGNLFRATRGDQVVDLVGTYHLADPRHDAMLAQVAPLLEAATLPLVEAVSGLLVAPLGSVESTWQAALLLLPLGLLSGFMQVTVYTWIQRRVPVHMMGRAMSIFMFIFMGLAPLSAAGTGWLLSVVSLPMLFLGGGAMLVAVAACAWLLTPIRAIEAERPVAAPDAAA